MSLCPNKSSKEWKDLSAGLTERLAGKSSAEIDAVAHIAYILKADGTVPSVDEAVTILTKNGKKQFTETVKTASKAFRIGAEQARKDAFLAGQMRQGRDMAPKIRALENKLAEGKITEAEYKERIKELEYEGRFKEAEARLAAEIEGKKAGRKEGVKEQTAFQKEFAKKISDFIKSSEKLRGTLSTKQVEAVIRKASSIGTSDKAFKKFNQYFEKIVSNANYDKDLSTGISLQKKLVNPFAEAADLIKRMKGLPLEYLSSEDLQKFNTIAASYVASKAAPTSPQYRPFDAAQAEKLFKPLEIAVNDAITSDVEDAYGVIGLTNEEALILDEFMSSEDMDEYASKLNEAKKKALRTNLENVANYSLLGLKEKLLTSSAELESLYGKDFVDKLERISNLDVKLIDENNQLAEVIKTVDNIIVNNSNANVNNALAIVLAAENNQKLKEVTNPVTKFLVGAIAKFYYDTPIVLQRIFGNTKIEAAIRRLTGMDDVITASTDSERIVINKVKEYQKFRKQIGLDNSAETDITIGVYADLINVKNGSEDADFLNNKAQLEQSIDAYNSSTDPEDKYIGELLQFLYDSSVKESNTLADFKKKYSAMHSKEVEAAKWVNENVWKQNEQEFKKHAEEDLNETFDADERENYQPRRYKRVSKEAEQFDPNETIFKNSTLKPKETGRSKERKLINTIPKNKAVEYRFEFNTFKTFQEQLFTAKSHLGAKTFHYMSKNDAAMQNIFGGKVNAEFFTDAYKKQYELMRYGKKSVDELFKSIIMSATRIVKDLGSSIALGRPTQALSQATPLVLAAVRNPKFMLDVISKKVPTNIELYNLAPIGSRGIEMGAAGRAEESEALTYSKTQRGAKKFISNISDVTSKIRELALTALTNTDVYVAKKAFAAYYLEYMNDVAKIPTTTADLETEHERMDDVRKMALSYAQQSIDKTQGVSTRVLQSEFKKNQTGSSYGEIVKNIIMPFNNFSSNTKARTIEDGAKIIYGNRAQKIEAGIDLAGTVLETAVYQAINVFIVSGIYRFGIKEVLKKAFDIEDDEEFYKSMSGSFRKYYTYVLRDLTVSGVGPAVEAAGVYVLNRMAYLFSEDAWNDTGKDFFEWLKDEPTFQPSYKPKNTSEFSFYDGLGVYGIPFETAQKSISDISYSVKGVAEAPVSFEKRTEKVGSRTDMFGVNTKDVKLTDEQKRFFLFMGIANGISALSGFQDADIMRAGEKLKSNIKRGERIRQFPVKRSAPKIKGGIKTPKAGTGGLKTGR